MSFYRRDLPHLQREGKPHFVTFTTHNRWVLPPQARTIVLECCLKGNGVTMSLLACVVMPDHAHLLLVPLIDSKKQRTWPLYEILNKVKNASAHLINRRMGRQGQVWQEESFDHVLRSSEKVDEKIAYLLNNPVRKGLAEEAKAYPWLWCAQPEMFLVGRKI